MATTTAPPPRQPPPPATITIADHTPNPDNNLYDITFQTPATLFPITTTVTADAAVAATWITTLLSSPTPPTTFGLDVEWRPNFSRHSDNPVATLQLCTSLTTPTTNYTCLIFQLLHCETPLPGPLRDLLANKGINFVGAGIGEDVEKLIVDHDLVVAKTVDIGRLAREKGVEVMEKSSTVGLKELARVVLGVEVGKPKSVTMSRWDQGWLSYKQVQYACVDAFLSFEIGSRLLALPAPTPA